MDLSQTRSRSSNSSSFPLNKEMQELVGLRLINLLVFETNKPFHQAQIVFKTKNLTKSFFKNNATPSNGKSQNNTVGIIVPNIHKPCLFTSLFAFSSPYSFKNTSSSSVLGSTMLEHTVCVKHRNSGFLPLEYVRALPEYTLTIHKYPVPKVVHRFEDCVFVFPHTQHVEVDADYYSRPVYYYRL